MGADNMVYIHGVPSHTFNKEVAGQDDRCPLYNWICLHYLYFLWCKFFALRPSQLWIKMPGLEDHPAETSVAGKK
jgi:hypothetical protein